MFGSATLTRSTVSDNYTSGSNADGGGVFASSHVTLTDSTVSRNRAVNALSGGVHSEYLTTVSRSTIVNNSARFGAGGLYSGGARYIASTISDSTISGNSIEIGSGAGILGNEVVVIRSTITENHAPHVASLGGGIYANVIPLVRSSIVAGNTAGGGNHDLRRAGGLFIVQNSLIGDNSGTSLVEAPVGAPDANGNLIGGPVDGLIDPQLGPLAYHGGPTLPDGSKMLTHSLLPGSPAIDAGDPAAVAGVGSVPLFDQRGTPFSRVFAGRIDMGAYEAQSLALVVDTLVDESDGDYSMGDFSLREAIELANANPGADAISFDPALTAGGPATILLTQGELAIADSLTINGPGAGLLTIDASASDPTPEEDNGDGSRVFNIADGNIGTFFDVALVGMTITGGDVTGAGGGILNEENLAITGCVVTANNATMTGGGISHRLGSLSLVASEVSHNTAASNGGGLVVSASSTPANVGKLVIRQSQINDNSAMLDGGGINLSQSSRLEIEESEIAGNTAGRNGGGVFVASAGLVLSDSIVAENHATAGSGGGLYGGSTVNLQVFQTLVRDNTSSGGGGGIAIVSGLAGTATSSALLVRDSMLLGNSAAADGGGISLAGGVHALVNSTIAGNAAGGNGGGVSNGSQTATAATAEMMQVTISGNRAGNRGGGVIGGEGTKITRSTIAENVANSDGVGGGNGGGVYSVFGSPGIVVDQTIIGNNQLFNTSQDWYGESGPEVTRSLIEKSAGTLGGYVYGNMVGLDPKLGPLEDNGGPIFLDGSRMLTHALLADSPAIDAGDPTGGTAALAAAYRATVLGDVPSYYYRFEETSLFVAGAKEEVTAQSNLVGAYSGSPTVGVAGAIPGGVAVEFDGVNDFVRSAFTAVSIGSKATVEVWARSATETWNASGWIARSDVRNLFVINPIQGTKAWSALLYDATNVAHVVGTFTPDVAVDIREWHQFALSWDQTTGAATMYFDGVAVAANTIAAALPQTTTVQVLTGWNDNSSTPAYGLGAVDELALYNHVLSADAIAEHYLITQLGTFDERGGAFARVFDGDGVSGARIDIGALERPPIEAYQLVVDSLSDENDGDHSPGHFSLREAIAVAQANPETATIEFAPALTAVGPATILLTQGELAIADSLTIHGPGAHLLTIDASGNDPTPNSTLNDGVVTNDGDGSRVLNIDDKTSAVLNVEIIGLGLTGGDANQDGGGVVARENLTLRECIVSENTSKSYGGGIFSGTTSFSSSSLTVVDCVVADNATGHEGGGIRKVIGDLTVDRSVIDGNQSGAVGGGISAADLLVQVLIRDSVVRKNRTTHSSLFGGGGIFLYDAIATIANTAVVENESFYGGGIYSYNSGSTIGPSTGVTTIVNCTVSENVSPYDVGGIYAIGRSYVSHSTVANNAGDGIEGTVDVYSTIVAGNSSPGSLGSDGFNLVNDSSLGILGPLVGSGEHVFLDGSRMRTHALLAGSPAIDTGKSTDAAGVGSVPEFDQRGTPFGRVVNGDAVGAPRIDIGAYERRADEELSFVVDTLADEDGDDYSPGDRSLREAIELANAHPGVDTITFSPELTAAGPGTIWLKYGEMAITEAVVIDGPGADLITVDAQQQSRVFNITATTGDFEIDGLMLSHGKTTGNNVSGPNPYVFSGGAIRSVTLGTITIDDTHIIDSGTSGNGAGGGGVFAQGAILLNRSVVSGNATMGNEAHGGGIFAHRPIVLSRSVVSGNTTAGEGSYGGGVATLGKIDVLDSVVDDNQVLGLNQGGGGIWSRGNVSLTQSVVSNNRVMNGSSFFSPISGGGGVFVRNGSATVTDSSISGNSTVGVPGRGGGIHVYQGTLAIVRSTVSDNHAGGRGGGVSCRNTLTVDASTIFGNSADGFGGGINGSNIVLSNSTVSGNSVSSVNAFYLAHGGGLAGTTVTVTNSTISGNSADGNGGGVWKSSAGSLIVTGSTISGNSASAGGGLLTDGSSTIRHSTIAFNTTTGVGKGIFVNGGSLLLDHSIVARNTGTNGDVNGLLGTTITAQYSFVGNNQGSGQLPASVESPDANGNLIGTNSEPINPYLSPLANNGGPTLTHALLPGSPAIDAGDPAAVAGENGVPQFDQRGEPWARVASGRIDMGAVEWQANPLPGDYNFNGVVDAADYSVWRDTVGSTNDLRADGDSDGMIDADDYDFWKANFGNVLAVGSGASVLAPELPADPEAGYPAGVGAGSAVMTLLPFDATIMTRKPPADAEAGYPAGAAWRESVVIQRRDDALMAWFARRGGTPAIDEVDGVVERDAGAGADPVGGILNDVFAELGCGL